jgi:hypothetical protein
MSRRVYLLGVGLALVALALAVTDWALSLQPGVTEANLKRIRPGMTLAEVETLLGSRPVGEEDLYEVVRRDIHHCCLPAGWYARHAWRRHWRGPAGVAVIDFGLDGTLTEVTFAPASSASCLDRLRAWLGW